MYTTSDEKLATSGRGLDTVLGLELVHADGNGVTATLEIGEIHHQPFGIVHGGVYCAVAESVASISAYLWLQETGLGGTAVGVNNVTDFLRSISDGTVTASSTPVHRGRRQQLWVVEITDKDGRAIARAQVRLHNLESPVADGHQLPPRRAHQADQR